MAEIKEIAKEITEDEMDKLSRLEYGLAAAKNIMEAVASAIPLNEDLYDRKSNQYSEIFVEYNINMNKLGNKYFKDEMVKYPVYSMYFDMNSNEFVFRPTNTLF